MTTPIKKAISRSKPTPGPWVKSLRGLSDDYTIRILSPNDGRLICTIASSINDKANSLLIAAAPEMFLALQHVFAWMEASQLGGDLKPWVESVLQKAENNGAHK